MDASGIKAKKNYLIIGGIVGAVIFLFILLGPPKMLAKSESPDFCVSCHVMGAEYESWLHEGAHRRIKCVDCHLPNGDLATHYSWKTVDGLKDVAVFYSGLVPERITISEHGKRVLKENCIRCHENVVSMINQERNCWECHRRLMHTRSGLISTL
ncbi:MAG TPA: cytochrome c nitrite reductase small subunit [Nitrospirota bacterium]|nr:cytochrome c nitrite reductase small subunit [Nitrospirota bacterium]